MGVGCGLGCRLGFSLVSPPSPVPQASVSTIGTQTLERWTGYSKFLYGAGTLVDGQGKPLAKEPDWSTYFRTDLL